MKRGRLPLTALRSFEAAGRLESVTLAAEELYVSQAAVSRQIRELEILLGHPLFARRHRQIRLTAEGAELLGVLTRAFDAMGDSLDALSQRQSTGELSLSVEPSFATGWLVDALARFRSEHPCIDVIVESNAQLNEFRSGQAELAIRFSRAHTSWPRSQAKWLYDVSMVPVAARAMFNQTELPSTPEQLSRLGLLHEDTRAVWEQWFLEAGVKPDQVQRGPVYADGGLVKQAVLGCQGIGLIDTRMIGKELGEGSLIKLFDRAISFGAYFIVARDFTRLSRPARAFADWIEAEFAREDATAS